MQVKLLKTTRVDYYLICAI